MIKKIVIFVGLILILGFNFLGTEYLLYFLLSEKSKLFYLFFVLFLTSIVIIINALNKFNWYHKGINSLIVLTSVFVGLGALKIVLFLC